MFYLLKSISHILRREIDGVFTTHSIHKNQARKCLFYGAIWKKRKLSNHFQAKKNLKEVFLVHRTWSIIVFHRLNFYNLCEFGKRNECSNSWKFFTMPARCHTLLMIPMYWWNIKWKFYTFYQMVFMICTNDVASRY